MIKVGRSLSQLVDSKRTRESSGGRRGGSVVNPQKSFFSFEKQGIRKSLKGDRTDSYQGPKFSHISLTPKSAVTIQPPKKVGLFFLSFFLFFLFFFPFHFFRRFFPSFFIFPPFFSLRDGEVIVRRGWGFRESGTVSYASRSSAGRFCCWR